MDISHIPRSRAPLESFEPFWTLTLWQDHEDRNGLRLSPYHSEIEVLDAIVAFEAPLARFEVAQVMWQWSDGCE